MKLLIYKWLSISERTSFILRLISDQMKVTMFRFYAEISESSSSASRGLGSNSTTAIVAAVVVVVVFVAVVVVIIIFRRRKNRSPKYFFLFQTMYRVNNVIYIL